MELKKKVLQAVFLLIASTPILSQQLEMCGGAGSNPVCFYELKKECGVVEVFVGDMPIGEQVFKLHFNNACAISSIEVTAISGDCYFWHIVRPVCGVFSWVGYSSQTRKKGDYILFTYKVIFKQA